jgi:putative transposase
MAKVRKRHPFHIEAIVVLPNHLHALWTLPKGDCDYPMRRRLIKAGFSRRIGRCERRSRSRIEKGERGLWQRRYWEHLIRNERDYARHVEYIHFNPVKHGYEKRASYWPYSSIHRYIKAGLTDQDWGMREGVDETNEYGES